MIGKAVVENFVRLGSRVVLCDLPDSDGKDFADSFKDNCLFVPTDVSKLRDIKTPTQTNKQNMGST